MTANLSITVFIVLQYLNHRENGTYVEIGFTPEKICPHIMIRLPL